MNPKKKIIGVVMAGGRSSRMGKDKGLLPFRGITLAQVAGKKLQNITDQVVISANNPEYEQFGLPVVSDIVKEKGPIGGILTALLSHPSSEVFILSCDTPLVDDLILQRLISEREAGYQAIVPALHGEPEPLCAIYDHSAAPILQNAIKNGNFKMKDVLKELRVKYIEISPAIFKGSFRNLNTPEELKALEKENL